MDMMDLKIRRESTRLATPAVSLQDLAAKSAINFGIKLQTGLFGTYPSQIVP
jgi:hypothetical protein